MKEAERLKNKGYGGGAKKGNKKENRIDGRELALGLVLIFFMLFFGVRGWANPAGTLGAINIDNPSGTSHHYVYFGNSEKGTLVQNGEPYQIDGPMLFRVLSTTANGTLKKNKSDAATTTQGLFMMLEYGLCQRRWDDNSQDWESSEIKAWLNGTDKSNGDVLCNCFSEEEQAAIAYTSTDYDNNKNTPIEWQAVSTKDIRKATKDGSGTKTNALVDTQLFLLSAEEVTNAIVGNNGEQDNGSKMVNRSGIGYGFQYSYNASYSEVSRYTFLNKDICKLGFGSEQSVSSWCLRSAYTTPNTRISYVDSTGVSYGMYVYQLAGVRFALNLHLSSIISAEPSTSSVAASATSTFGPIASLSQYATVSPEPAAYKLTIASGEVDSTFHIDEASVAGVAGGNITLTYHGTDAGQNICAVIKKNDNSACYFARALCDVEASNAGSKGTVSMTLPSNIEVGNDYTMIVYAESDNGDKKTSIAQYDTVSLNVIHVLKAYKHGTNVLIEAKSDEKLCKVTEGVVGSDITTKSWQINMAQLSNNNLSTVYVHDKAGNCFPVELIEDISNPTVQSLSYNNGTMTLTANDSQSGIWKITNADGSVVLADYS